MIIIGKDVPLKCGFYNEKINDRKELHTKYSPKTGMIISCPHYNAILGFKG